MAQQIPDSWRDRNPIVEDWSHLVLGAFYDLYGGSSETEPFFRHVRCENLADGRSAFFRINGASQEIWKHNYMARPARGSDR